MKRVSKDLEIHSNSETNILTEPEGEDEEPEEEEEEEKKPEKKPVRTAIKKAKKQCAGDQGDLRPSDRFLKFDLYIATYRFQYTRNVTT